MIMIYIGGDSKGWFIDKYKPNPVFELNYGHSKGLHNPSFINDNNKKINALNDKILELINN